MKYISLTKDSISSFFEVVENIEEKSHIPLVINSINSDCAPSAGDFSPVLKLPFVLDEQTMRMFLIISRARCFDEDTTIWPTHTIKKVFTYFRYRLQ